MLNFKNELRARAHALNPVVWVSENGPTESVIREINTALNAHELIKIRLNSDSRETRQTWIVKICAETDALHIQTIGKIVVVFRKSDDSKNSAKGAKSKKTPRLQKRDFQN